MYTILTHVLLLDCTNNTSGWMFNDNKVWMIIRQGVAAVEPAFRSNAWEADQVIWRNATMCCSSNVLIYSPDTNVYVYNIYGLTIPLQCSKEVIIQNNVLHALSNIKTYVHLNTLAKAFLT